MFLLKEYFFHFAQNIFETLPTCGKEKKSFIYLTMKIFFQESSMAAKGKQKRQYVFEVREKFLKVSVLILVCLGLGLSIYGYVLEQKISRGLEPGGLCSAIPGSTCEEILSSAYAEWYGIPTTLLAGVFYLVMGLLLFLPFEKETRHRYLLLGSGFGVLMSLIMAYFSFWVIQGFCPVCVLLYIINIGLFICVVFSAPSFKTFLKRAWADGNFKSLAFGIVLFTAAFLWTGRSQPAKPPDVVPRDETSVTQPDKNFETQLQDLYKSLEQKGRLSIPEGICTPVLGEPGAPIRFVEFSDLQCPYCARLGLDMEQLKEEFGDVLYVEFCHFPLDMQCNPSIQRSLHEHACQLAYIAECAAQMGMFWPIHKEIFLNQANIGQWLQGILPGTTGPSQFIECSRDPSIQKRVHRQIQLGIELGITGTPAFYINGLQIHGYFPSPSYRILKGLIELELKRVRASGS